MAGEGFCEFAEAGLARVLDRVLPNAYAILDAGHTYKMLALGELVATDILDRFEPRLAPFRLDRLEAGRMQPASHSPYPST
ncbi:MAG: hypothetical protein WBP81_33255 [Solirubrobacteraceae bacterium]